MEVIAAIQDCGASLALPTSLMQIDSTTSFISTSTTYAGRSSASALHHGAVSPTTTGSARNSNSNSNRSSGVGVGAEEDDEDYEEETDSGGGTDDTESGTGKGTGRRDTRGTSSSCSSSDLAEEMELAEALQSLPRGVTMQDDAEDDRLLGEHLPLGSAEAAAAAVVAAGLNGDRVSTVVGQGVNEARSAPTIIPTDSSARGARGAWDSAPMKNRQQQVEAQADFSFDVRTFGNPALSPHPQQSQSFVAAVDADDIDVDDDTVSAATVTASAVPAVAVAATVEYVNDDIWHESLRSAGIRTDTKKYFVEAVAAAATPTATTTAGSGGDVERHQQGHQHIERISSPEASPQRPTSVFWEQDSSNTDAIQIVDSSKRDELQ